ncbi:MAG: NAD-dependent epimerase/dehydratase family protein [Sphingomonadales bacterium]|nr:NAD-dependent epimerase/dehydratase family protein [Sphingomonadales bacterium]
MSGTVLVTGGTGYIGGEVIDQLLARGRTVHTTVRDAGKSEPLLRARWPEAGRQLEVFSADLLDDAGWGEAIAGCTHVAHVASPFPMGVPKDDDELVVPAREGTLRALRFARAAGVTRFVQTSSAAAIAYGHPADKTHFTQDDWTDLDGPGVAPYIKSKTVAERAARDWVAANAPEMEFCSINPVMVTGPVASGDFSTSIEVVKMMLDGAMPMLPPIGFGVVDVRDVAKAHVLALEAPAATVRDGRFPVSERFLWAEDIAAILRNNLGKAARRVPSRVLPSFLIPVLAVFMPELRQVKGDARKLRDIDGSHATSVLGFEYIPASQSLLDTASSLIARGLVKG